MAARLDALLDSNGLRPPSVVCAAVLGVLAGSMALLASLILFGAMSGPAGWAVLLVWLVALAQVAGAVLLIIGGVRVALGAGRGTLIAGAVLQVLVSASYLLYDLTVVAHDTAEPRATVVAIAVIAGVFAVVPVVGVVLALLPAATEYLVLLGGRQRLGRG